MTKLRSGVYYRVCLWSVTFVRPTQWVETFGNITSPFSTSFELCAKFCGDRFGGTLRWGR